MRQSRNRTKRKWKTRVLCGAVSFILAGSLFLAGYPQTEITVHAQETESGDSGKKTEAMEEKTEAMEEKTEATEEKTEATEKETEATKDTTGAAEKKTDTAETAQNPTKEASSTEDADTKEDTKEDSEGTSGKDADTEESSESSGEADDTEKATVTTEDTDKRKEELSDIGYDMPTEIKKGTTAYQKEKKDAYAKQIKKIRKQIEKIEDQKLAAYQNIGQIRQLMSDQQERSITADKTNVLMGTKRTYTEGIRSGAVYGTDEQIRQLALAMDDEALLSWIAEYTTEGEVALRPDQDVPDDLFSSGAEALSATIERQHSAIDDLDVQIEGLEKQITTLRRKKKEIMTPRVFDPNDVTKVSGLSVSEAEQMLDGTALEPLAATFVQCEKDYGVNAVFLMGIAAWESNWGRSRRAVQDHNYTGFGVYSDSAKGKNADTGAKNLDMTAAHLQENYLTEGGSYYHGVAVNDVHRSYCATGGWSTGVVTIAYRLMDVVLE